MDVDEDKDIGYSHPSSPVLEDIHAVAQHQVQNEVPPKTSSDFPEGGYGWVVTIACAFVNGHTWGMNSVSEVYVEWLRCTLNMVTIPYKHTILCKIAAGCESSLRGWPLYTE